MTWTQSKISYYADFVVVPFLIGWALPYIETARGLALIPAGFITWTLVEYLIHRYIFHNVMRHAHWMHHIRPQGFVASPSWLTGAFHFGALTAVFYAHAYGFFVGLEAGYYAYIVTHDRIHHAHYVFQHTWLYRRVRLHDVHHRGVEANFGVVTSFWDHAFDTYCPPREMQRWLKLQKQNRQGA